MTNHLIPKSSRLLPSKASRQFHLERNRKYGPDKFQCYNDWFYFIHIDPILRWWHGLGMMTGIIFYIFAALDLWVFGLGLSCIIKFLVGVFFFYFLPLISHFIYDGGTAKSSPDKFHSTLIPVVHINLLTLTGSYDSWLRKFIEKYPFTKDAWDLEEKKVSRFTRMN